jgi:DNA-binding NarL/FixJ family response regulator
VKQLHLSGKGILEIAHELKISKETVKNDLKKIYSDTKETEASDSRYLESARLKRHLKISYRSIQLLRKAAEKGDRKATTILIETHKRLSKDWFPPEKRKRK